MTDQHARVEKMDDQAMALMESLLELMAGRPIDVALDALGTAAQRLIVVELDLTEEEVEAVLLTANGSVLFATKTISATREARLRQVFRWAACLTMMTPTINLSAGEDGESRIYR